MQCFFSGCQRISLEGTWKATINLTDLLKPVYDLSDDEDGAFYGEFNEPISIDLIYTFDKLNNCMMSVDEEKFRTDYYAYIEKNTDYMVEGEYKYAESKNITREQVDAFYQEKYGKSLRQWTAERLDAETECDKLLNDLSDEKKQFTVIDDNKFYVVNSNGERTSYESFTLDGDTLTIHGRFNMDGEPVKDDKNIYPIVLIRQTD